MLASPESGLDASIEQAWRDALVEAERARQAYAEYLRHTLRDESELERLWLRLWSAERRRDQLLRMLD